MLGLILELNVNILKTLFLSVFLCFKYMFYMFICTSSIVSTIQVLVTLVSSFSFLFKEIGFLHILWFASFKSTQWIRKGKCLYIFILSDFSVAERNALWCPLAYFSLLPISPVWRTVICQRSLLLNPTLLPFPRLLLLSL